MLCKAHAMRGSRGTVAVATLILLVVGSTSIRAEAAPVPVRFVEGVTRGFLVVKTPEGKAIATGDLLQVVKARGVESRMLLRFSDGSVFDETVVFSQQRVFTLLSYRLTQRGPTFPEELEVSVDREKGVYSAQSRRGDKRDDAKGTIDLPPDVYNGMAVILLKNLGRGESGTVRMLAFTPKPTVIQLELRPAGEDPVTAGTRPIPATHFVLAPKLGMVKRAGAMLLGKSPSDYHCWIVTADVPAFVRMAGSLYPGGPRWLIEPVSPEGPLTPPPSR